MGEGYRPDRFSEADDPRGPRDREPARRDPWSAALGIRPVRLRDYELPDEHAPPAGDSASDHGTSQDDHADEHAAHHDEPGDPDTPDKTPLGDPDTQDETPPGGSAAQDETRPAHPDDLDDLAGQFAAGPGEPLDQPETAESSADFASPQALDHLGDPPEEPPGSDPQTSPTLDRSAVHPAEFAEPDEAPVRRLKASDPPPAADLEPGAATDATPQARPPFGEWAGPDEPRRPETPRDRPGTVGADGVRRFATDADGDAYGEQVLGATFDQLDPAAQKAVYEYTRDSDPYNFVLRAAASGADPQTGLDKVLADPEHRSLVVESFDGHQPTVHDVYRRISDIDAALSHPLPESIEIHRGLRSAKYLKGSDKDIRELRGTIQQEAAFVSASLGESAAFGGRSFPVQLHLRVPGNMEGLWIGRRSRYPSEREILLPRGLRYEITEVVPDEDGRWHLYATAIESDRKQT